MNKTPGIARNLFLQKKINPDFLSSSITNLYLNSKLRNNKKTFLINENNIHNKILSKIINRYEKNDVSENISNEIKKAMTIQKMDDISNLNIRRTFRNNSTILLSYYQSKSKDKNHKISKKNNFYRTIKFKKDDNENKIEFQKYNSILGDLEKIKSTKNNNKLFDSIHFSYNKNNKYRITYNNIKNRKISNESADQIDESTSPILFNKTNLINHSISRNQFKQLLSKIPVKKNRNIFSLELIKKKFKKKIDLKNKSVSTTTIKSKSTTNINKYFIRF